MSDVFGIQAVRAALREQPERARCLYVQKNRRDARINELIGLAREQGVRYQVVDPAWLKRRVDDATHQGAVLECRELSVRTMQELEAHLDVLVEAPLLLILDGITDPRNLGACLRTANATGVHGVILPKRQSAPLTGVALKTAQGGAESLFLVEVSNLARCMTQLAERGVWLTGTDGAADTSYAAVDYAGPTAIVVGSEGKGLRRLTKEKCDRLVGIPMRGTVDSLNVSVATGIVLYEVLRQRGQ